MQERERESMERVSQRVYARRKIKQGGRPTGTIPAYSYVEPTRLDSTRLTSIVTDSVAPRMAVAVAWDILVCLSGVGPAVKA